MSKVRSFIAIPTPEEVKTILTKIQSKLKSIDSEVKWEPADKLHITLKFFGDVDNNILPSLISEVVEQCCNQKSFSLIYGELGCFPNLKEPRIVWAGSKNEDGLLEPLKKIIDEIGKKYGFEPEKREFHPHITLGRVKGRRNIPSLIKTLQSITFVPRTFLIDELYFMKSELRPSGSVYIKLQSIILKK